MAVARSIFISYRRRDSIDITGRIHDRLVAQFGPDSVFKDVDAIPFGVDFRKHLEREVSHCPALLAIIGPSWLDATDTRGQRRLDYRSDWVRLEIETALKRDSVVIPVLVGGAKLPKDNELPESLKGLAYRQCAVVRHDPDFHRDMDRLIQRIEEVFTGLTLTGHPASSLIVQPTAAQATLVADPVTPPITAREPEPALSNHHVSRRRWLRLMGLGLVGGMGAIATHKWLPSLQAMSQRNLSEQLPDLSTLPDRLQSALSAATADVETTDEAEATLVYTYKSVTVDEKGVPLYHTQFTTNFYEIVALNTMAGLMELSMVAITGSQFLFGASESELPLAAGQIPQTIAAVDSFWIGIYPITQQQWRAVASLPAINLDLSPDPAQFKGDKHPVEQVSWYEAVEFCERLSRYTRQRFRLPTETEWEYACRAKTTTPFHYGQTITTDLANYDGTQAFRAEPTGPGRGETTPVGYFQQANDFGLYDAHGNVLEWCSDRWANDPNSIPQDEPIPAPSILSQDPQPLLERELRVLRGGSWQSLAHHCRSAYRTHSSADLRSNTIGFRVVREMDAS